MSSYEKITYRTLLRRILGQDSNAHRVPSVVKNIKKWLAEIPSPYCISAYSSYVLIHDSMIESVTDELRRRFYKTYISKRMFYEQAKAKMYIVPTNFEILIHSSETIINESFSIFHGNKKSFTEYVNANTLNDFLAEYEKHFDVRVNVPLLREQSSKRATSYRPHLPVFDASDVVGVGRATPSPLTVPTFSIAPEKVNQYVADQLAPSVDSDTYFPMDEKSNTLRSLIKKFIERNKDLYEQQNLLAPDPKREGRIKSIIMNLVYILQTQKEYIKRCFNIDIDIIIQRYNNGQWMSDIELEKFFDMESKRHMIVTFAFAKTKQKGC